MSRYCHALLVLAFLALSANAQVLSLQRGSAIDTLASALADPSLTTSVRAPNADLQISTTVDGEAAQAQIGWMLTDRNFLRLKVSGPVSKGGKPTLLAAGDSLSSGVTAEVSAQHVFWRFRQMSEVEANNALAEICRPPTGCPNPTPTQARQLQQLFAPLPIIIGATAGYGRQDFEFLEATTFNETSVSRDPFEVKANAGIMPPRGLYYIGATVSYKRGYKAADQINLCTPVGGGDALNCRDAVIGGPTEKKGMVLALEGIGYYQNFGVSPRLARDSSTDAWTFDLPIYLLRDKFNGGISVGYNSSTDKATIALFVGAMQRVPLRK